ncbi:jerky-like protein [Trichonephila clavipes]|nr:jerky-like protein [Trichonephila clavipes]
MARRKRKPRGSKRFLDSALYLRFSQRRREVDTISDPLLCERALELNEKLVGSADFKANTGWLKNFKSHHEIRKLQIEGKSLSGDRNSAHKYKETFLQYVEEEFYYGGDVYNVNETGVNSRLCEESHWLQNGSLQHKVSKSARNVLQPWFSQTIVKHTLCNCL